MTSEEVLHRELAQCKAECARLARENSELRALFDPDVFLHALPGDTSCLSADDAPLCYADLLVHRMLIWEKHYVSRPDLAQQNAVLLRRRDELVHERDVQLAALRKQHDDLVHDCSQQIALLRGTLLAQYNCTLESLLWRRTPTTTPQHIEQLTSQLTKAGFCQQRQANNRHPAATVSPTTSVDAQREQERHFEALEELRSRVELLVGNEKRLQEELASYKTKETQYVMQMTQQSKELDEFRKTAAMAAQRQNYVAEGMRRFLRPPVAAVGVLHPLGKQLIAR